MKKFEHITKHYEEVLKSKHIKELLDDPLRNRNLLFETPDFLLDLTREKLDYFVLEEFQKLFNEHVKHKIDSMFKGEKINVTEGIETLYYALRAKEPL